MKRSQGFTVIEIIVVAAFLGIAAVLVLTQRSDLEAAQRDAQRKTAINAMHYNLEEVYYEKNGYYPSNIDSSTLTAMDPSLFTDPDGVKMGEPDAQYHYEASDCLDNKCNAYKLRADMEKEATYTKANRDREE